MSAVKDDDLFVLRTRVALAALKADADKVRRNLPNPTHACADKSPCRNCAALRVINQRIDDHLNQLQDANLLAAP